MTYWVVTGGGTAISMLVGWWLASRGGKAGRELAAPDAAATQDAAERLG